MKNVNWKKRFKRVCFFISVILGVLILVAKIFGIFDFLFTGISAEADMTRTDIHNKLFELEEKLNKNQEDLELKTEVAYYYYFLGDFDRAEKIISEVVEKKPKSFNPYSLLSELYYLKGDYNSAEEIMLSQIKKHPYNFNVVSKCQARLLKIYYQKNQYEKVGDYKVLKSIGTKDFVTWIENFEGIPNTVTFKDEKKVEIPFLFLDPLPLVEININGDKSYAFIDTGADTFILDTGRAISNGMGISGSFSGEFAGELSQEVGFSKIEEIKLGSITMSNVPIMIMPLDDINDAFLKEYGNKVPDGFKIDGVIGTKVLQQFLSTIDYIGEKLILRERSNESLVTYLDSIKDERYEAFPFYMENLHTIVAKGNLMDREVMFYLDSGLAGDASLAVTENTLNDFSIELPEVVFDENAISGGGKGFEQGFIKDICIAGIGKFIMDKRSADYYPNSDMYWESDFIIDAMLSHNYLKNYSWTIDFDNMMMYLVE